MKRWALRPTSWGKKPGKTERVVQAVSRSAPKSAAFPPDQTTVESSKRTTRRRQRERPVAASLPALEPGQQASLTSAAEQMRSQRAGAPAHTDRITRMAVRLQSGRKLKQLMSLMASGLFQGGSPATSSEDARQLQPATGLTATLGEKDVLVLGTLTFRALLKCDVVPVVERRGPGQTTHTFDNSSVLTCKASELTNVRYCYRVVRIKKRRAWLEEVGGDTAETDVHRDLTACSNMLGPLRPAQQSTDPGALAAAISKNSSGAVLVTPKSSAEHAQTHGHRVLPRYDAAAGVSALKMSVVWDTPWPLELDVRPWRCQTCKHPGACVETRLGAHYFVVQPEDVCEQVPGTLWHTSGKDGGITFFTSRWLSQLYVALYETMSFRKARCWML